MKDDFTITYTIYDWYGNPDRYSINEIKKYINEVYPTADTSILNQIDIKVINIKLTRFVRKNNISFIKDIDKHCFYIKLSDNEFNNLYDSEYLTFINGYFVISDKVISYIKMFDKL